MTVNSNRLFIMSCMSLTVTSMTFAIRAGILGQLGAEFELNNVQLGWVNGIAFFGFPIAMIVGGLVYNSFGAKNLMIIAFFGHLLGLVMTIFANGFETLLISTFLVGAANGAVEAACNPLVADTYHKNKTTMLNRFHVWFPGGIVIGALLSKFLGDAGYGWQIQIATMIPLTLAYGFMVFTEKFPETQNIESDTMENIKAMVNPLFVFMVILMTVTAATELVTGGWIDKILKGSGASGMLVLALTAGLMAVGRFFAGPIVHRFNPLGVLFGSAILSAIGIFMFTVTSGAMVYLAAVIFAFGVMYFWPTMIGFVSEYTPRTGASGMSLMGGAGALAVWFWNPVVGLSMDDARADAIEAGSSIADAESAAGQAALGLLNVFPVVLIVAFAILLFLKVKRPDEKDSVEADVSAAS